jgi:hypothetical protein
MTTIPLRAHNCSLCGTAGHNIRRCKHPSIENTIVTLNQNVEEIIPNVEIMRNLDTSELEIFNYVNTQLSQWIDNIPERLLTAVYIKLFENTRYTRSTLKETVKMLYRRCIYEVIKFRYTNTVNTLTNRTDIPAFVVKYMSTKVVSIVNEVIDANEMFGRMLELTFFGNPIQEHIVKIIEHIDDHQNSYNLTYDGGRIIRIIRQSFVRLRDRETTPSLTKIELVIHPDNTINDTHNCPICYEDYNAVDGLSLQCNHSFCKTCVINLLKNNPQNERTPQCALCRENIKSVSSFLSEMPEFIKEHQVEMYFG